MASGLKLAKAWPKVPEKPVAEWTNRETFATMAMLLDSQLTREVSYERGTDCHTGYPLRSWIDHDSRHLKECRITEWTEDYSRRAAYDKDGNRIVLAGAPCSVRCDQTRQAIIAARRILGMEVDPTL